MKTYPLALHIFRRDLRLEDNTALIKALSTSAKVIPIFIFDPRQIGNNSYKSHHSIQFMLNSLNELDAKLKEKNSHLYFFHGIAEDIVQRLLSSMQISAVFINRDYTPFSLQRDVQIEKNCRHHQVDFHCYADALLHEPEEVFKPNNKPYTVFTPFYRKSSQLTVSHPQKNQLDNYYSKPIGLEDKALFKKLLSDEHAKLMVKGGRTEAVRLMKKIAHLKDYQMLRNFPALDGTTKLSAHLKFGTISIREFYQAIINCFGPHHGLISELYWRDFFTHIVFHYPHVFGNAFYDKFANIIWENNPEKFLAWCEGNTGFPIVDAGMRELNATGYMHNRIRMIVASFLTKDLHIDWRWGERYFASKLVDYDPAVNNGNWQWAASTGCDAQPYFRIFNPWLQQKKFDSECVYIKKWVPELNTLPIKQLHELYKPECKVSHYPQPIVDHGIESQEAKRMYATLKKYK